MNRRGFIAALTSAFGLIVSAVGFKEKEVVARVNPGETVDVHFPGGRWLESPTCRTTESRDQYYTLRTVYVSLGICSDDSGDNADCVRVA